MGGIMKKIIAIVLVILIPIGILAIVDNYFSSRSKMYIEKEVMTVVSNTITQSLEQPIQDYIFQKDLLYYQYDRENIIKGIYINSAAINEILLSVNKSMKELLDKDILEQEIQDIQIPIGLLISKSLFTDFGPRVKIRVLPISFYKTDIITNMKSFGINNALFEIYLSVFIEIDTIIPLNKNHIVFATNILLVSQIIQGEVPYYYYSGDGTIEALPH